MFLFVLVLKVILETRLTIAIQLLQVNLTIPFALYEIFISLSLSLRCLSQIVRDEPIQDKCNPSPCAQNAQCDNGVCTCLPGLQGDPYTQCRPECVLNSDCPRTQACIRNKCVDPCESTRCAPNAICNVYNHLPMCTCPSGTEGNAFIQCRPIVQQTPVEEYHGCRPSPCGTYAQCREINNQAVCSCLPGYIGSPPTCRPECVVSSDCASNEACQNQKCINPCLGACGLNAECRVVNHNPICTCLPRYTGSALASCHPIGKEMIITSLS